jgi:hypothetical protein
LLLLQVKCGTDGYTRNQQILSLQTKQFVHRSFLWNEFWLYNESETEFLRFPGADGCTADQVLNDSYRNQRISLQTKTICSGVAGMVQGHTTDQTGTRFGADSLYCRSSIELDSGYTETADIITDKTMVLLSFGDGTGYTTDQADSQS